jgi:preprotein translocase subunit SecD
VILAVVAFLTYAIALTELQTFAFVFGIGTVLSGVCTLVVTRFIWAITMTFAKHKDKFCNFKHEEEDDDE